MKKTGFFSSLGKRKLGVVLNLFYAYMSLGLVLIMLGSILPEMKSDNALSYQVGGALLSVQAVGYVLAMFLIGIGKGGITNYNNLLMNIYSEGNAGPLNILHACFAAGAVIAPLIAMVVTGWRPAVIIGCVCCAASLAFLLPAGFSDRDLQTSSDALDASDASKASEDVSDKAKDSRKKKVDYGFIKEKLFWVTVIICFFYQAVEASFMGWMTSFLIDTGVMAESLAQFTTSVLWMALMAGRLLCSAAAAKFSPKSIILALTLITTGFMAVLLQTKSPAGLIIATAGIGLGMSGMFGTSVSNAGDIFSKYPVCMGFFVFMTSMGAIVAPAIIGSVANTQGMHIGMSTLLIFAACMVAAAIVNIFLSRKVQYMNT